VRLIAPIAATAMRTRNIILEYLREDRQAHQADSDHRNEYTLCHTGVFPRCSYTAVAADRATFAPEKSFQSGRFAGGFLYELR
jgi:hypothetical protein